MGNSVMELLGFLFVCFFHSFGLEFFQKVVCSAESSDWDAGSGFEASSSWTALSFQHILLSGVRVLPSRRQKGGGWLRKGQ